MSLETTMSNPIQKLFDIVKSINQSINDDIEIQKINYFISLKNMKRHRDFKSGVNKQLNLGFENKLSEFENGVGQRRSSCREAVAERS